MIIPLIIVAILSSVLGGAVVGAWLQFGAPAMAENLTDNNGSSTQGTQLVKQIEIINSAESPVTAIAEKVSPSIVGIQVNYTAYDFGLVHR